MPAQCANPMWTDLASRQPPGVFRERPALPIRRVHAPSRAPPAAPPGDAPPTISPHDPVNLLPPHPYYSIEDMRPGYAPDDLACVRQSASPDELCPLHRKDESR